MRREIGINLWVLTMTVVLSACGSDSERTDILTSATTQSACKETYQATTNTESLATDGTVRAVLTGPDTITIYHDNARYNCGHKITMQAALQMTGGAIEVREVITNPEVAGLCYCTFDLSVEIAGLEPGRYVVKGAGQDLDDMTVRATVRANEICGAGIVGEVGLAARVAGTNGCSGNRYYTCIVDVNNRQLVVGRMVETCVSNQSKAKTIPVDLLGTGSTRSPVGRPE